MRVCVMCALLYQLTQARCTLKQVRQWENTRDAVYRILYTKESKFFKIINRK